MAARVTTPTGKPRGLLGAVPQGLQPQSQNVIRGVAVSIDLKTAIGTLMQTHGQVFTQRVPDHIRAAATAPRRTTWINFDIRSTGTYSLVARIGGKLVPRGVGNAFRQAVVAEHPRNAQVLEHDHAKLVDQAAAQFMGEVLASVRDPFVDMGYDLAPSVAFWRSLFSLAEPALGFRQRPFVVAEKSRVGNLFTRRKRRKVRQANIDTNGTLRFWQRFNFSFNRKAGVPLAGTGAADGERLDRAFDGAMGDHLDASNLGHIKLWSVHPEGVGLWIGEAVVPARTLEPWIARCFPTLEAAKERLEC
jgi:hypothetical protein